MNTFISIYSKERINRDNIYKDWDNDYTVYNMFDICLMSKRFFTTNAFKYKGHKVPELPIGLQKQ